MPPKKKSTKKSKSTNKVDKKAKSKLENQIDYGVDDEDEISEEEIDEISDDEDLAQDLTKNVTFKEKYTYKPIIHTNIVYVKPDERQTSEVMTMFEYTEAISHRAKQIENGGACFTDIGDLTDPILIAEKELRDRKSPLCLQRKLSDKVYELWQVNEMAFPKE